MWKYIVIHHSLTKDGKVVDTQAIRRYHMSWAYRNNIVSREKAMQLIASGKRVKRPWIDIGYHFVSETIINNDWEILVGRVLNQVGAHTRGRNRDSLGICAVGNYDIIKPPEELIMKLSKFTKSLMEVFDIPISNVLGHCEINSNKTCPGRMFDLNSFRRRLS